MTTKGAPSLYLVSLFVIALGFGVVFATTLIPVTPVYSRIGPRLFPFMVGVALILLGCLLTWDARRGDWDCEATDPQTPAPDWKPLALVGAGLLLNVLLIERIGFILSSTIMYLFVAYAFGAPRMWLVGLIGFGLAAGAYFGFAKLLGLRMGDEPIEALIETIVPFFQG